MIDADVIARRVMEPGGPAHRGVVERFGPDVVAPDGTIDRAALAGVVFADQDARADLNAIVHPAVRAAMSEEVTAEASDRRGRPVVLVIPLLVESDADRPHLDGVVVVDCPVDVALDRLVHQRGMGAEDARARMAAQADREARLERADFVIDNSRTLEHLRREVERCWAWVEGLRPGG